MIQLPSLHRLCVLCVCGGELSSESRILIQIPSNRKFIVG